MPPVVAAVGAVASAVGTAVGVGAPIALATTTTVAAGSSLFASIATTLITGLITTAAQYALGASSSNKSTVASVNDSGSKQTVRGTVVKHRIIYGESLVGGAIFFYDCIPPHLYAGYALCAHEIDSLVNVRIGIQDVLFTPEGNAVTPPFYDGSRIYLKTSVRLGKDDQTIDPLLTAAFPPDGDNIIKDAETKAVTNLPTTFTQKGTATVVCKADYGSDRDDFEKVWNSRFEPLFKVRGKKIYDPRKPTHDVDDPSTWEWSNNATLIIIDYCMASYGGRRKASEIDWDSVVTAANYDDEWVDTLSGVPERRYTINGVITKGDSFDSVITSMLTANRGELVIENNKVVIYSGVRAEPEMTITDDDIMDSFEYRSSSPKKQMVNTLRAEFIAPDREYQTENMPVYKNQDYIDLDGEVLDTTLSLPFTEGASRAQRITKAFIEDSRLGKTVTTTVGHRFIPLRAGQVVRVAMKNFTNANGLYKVNQAGISNDLASVSLTLTEYDDTIYDWDYTVDEKPFELNLEEST